MQNFIKQQLEIREVKLITPLGTNDGIIRVARFTEDNVMNLVPDEPVCGVYLIGCCLPRINGTSSIQHEFRVCYFGRSDDNVKLRLHDHLINGGKTEELNRYDEHHYFAIWGCDSIQEAYEHEVGFYVEFFKDVNDRLVGNGYSNSDVYSHANGKHSAYLPYLVYVDNVNRPSEP